MKNDETPVVSFYKAEKKPAQVSQADSDLQRRLDAITSERDGFQRGMQTAQHDRDDLQRRLDALTAERQKLQAEYDAHVKASDETAGQLQAERDAARKALSEGKVIPADALKRITDVKGVGDKLAPEILAALTGK